MVLISVRRSALILLFAPWVGVALGQAEISPEEAAIDLIRVQEQVGESDQARIADWVRQEVNRLGQIPDGERPAAVKKFRDKFKKQFDDSRNTTAFKAQLPAQTARVAAEHLTTPGTEATVAYALVRVMVDMGRPEALPGLIAGLKSSAPAARYLSARGIYELQQAIAGNKEQAEGAIAALRESALVETSPVALGQTLRALGFATQPAVVLDAYLAIIDKRLPDLVSGGAAVAPDIEMFHYLRNPAVLSALNQSQKAQLAARVGSLLRVYADRYNVANLKFDEIDRIERALWSAEEVLEAMGGTGGGAVRKALEEGGYQKRGDIPAEAAKWVGDSQTNTAGALNAAPWNVPIGGLAAKPAGSTD